MTRCSRAVPLLALLAGCSSTSANSLTGSESQVYDLSFSNVVIVLQGSSVSVDYEGSNGDPAILVVDTECLASAVNVTIPLTDDCNGQPQGVLKNVNGGGDGVTDQLMITMGNVVFDQLPKVGSTLSGQFNATLNDGYTLNGTFSATVYSSTEKAP
jgi:hypothetical protein